MRRFEVRGEHPATAKTATSGRVERKDVATEARRLCAAGHVGLIVIDHVSGEERTVEDFLRPGEGLP